MAAGDNSTVSILIAVEDGGSAAAIQNVETKIVGLSNAVGSSNFRNFSSTLTGMSGQLRNVAAAAGSMPPTLVPPIPPEVPEQLNKMHGNMREVSGTARELGIRMGYSMRAFLAESPAVMGALRAMSGAFIAMAAVEIGEQVVEGVVHLYEKWISVDAAYDEYAEKVKKAQEEDVVNVRSIEDADARFDDLNKKFTTYLSLAQSLHSAGLSLLGEHDVVGGLALLLSARKTSGEGATAGAQGDEVNRKKLELQHEINIAETEEAHAADAALGPQQKITAELQKQYDLNYEQRRWTKQQDELMGNKTTRDSGSQLQGIKDETAAQAAAAKEIELRRSENEKIISMQNEAVTAGMRGEALYDRQRQDAIDAVTRKFQNGEISKRAMLSETESLDMKFHNEKMKRLEEEQYETTKILQETSQAGLTGIAKIQAEGQNKVEDLTANPANADLSTEDVTKRRAAYEEQTDAQILAEREKFQQEMNEIGQRSDQQQQAGYARIEAEARRSFGAIAKDYETYFGQLDTTPANLLLMVDGLQAAEVQVDQVMQNAARQRAELTQKTDEQITQIETQAARLTLPPWEQAQQQIIDEYQQRVEKATAELNQQLAYEHLTADELQSLWSQYYRTIAADSALAAAQMQKQMEGMRDQVAGQLQSLFDGPQKYLENRAKQMGLDIVANLVTQMMQSNPEVGGAIGGILGLNKMGTQANPIAALTQMFHPGGVAGAGGIGAGGAGGSALISAGSTLSSAGTTLSSSGTMLASSASQLQAAASTLMGLSSGGAGAGGGFGAGSIGQLNDMFSGTGGVGGSGTIGSGGTTDIASQAASLPGGGGGLAGAYSLAQSAGSLAGVGGTAGQVISGVNATAGQVSQAVNLLSGISSGQSAPLLNPQGGLQPSDLPPTSSSGVPGTVPDDATGFGATASTASSAGAAGVGIGAGLAAVSTGIALSQEWSAGNTGAAVLTGALGGASIGGMIGGLVGGPVGALIGMGIGAAGGALVGFVGSLFSDHGLSKAKQYNVDTVLPALGKEMTGFSGGNTGYDQASLDLNSLMVQAQQQCRSFGSAAVTYYNDTIVPEIQSVQAQVDRMSQGGRANVKMSAAQFDSGGLITSFGDMSTGPFSGFIHAQLGERVMNRTASMMYGSTLDNMNAGASALAAMRRASPLGSGSGSQGENHTHVHIHTMDTKTMDYWARNGGAQWLQSVVNQNVGRYGGKALS
jgi:hypothetical protein